MEIYNEKEKKINRAVLCRPKKNIRLGKNVLYFGFGPLAVCLICFIVVNDLLLGLRLGEGY